MCKKSEHNLQRPNVIWNNLGAVETLTARVASNIRIFGVKVTGASYMQSISFL